MWYFTCVLSVVEPGFEDNERMSLTGFKGDNMTLPCGLTGTLRGLAYKTIWKRNDSKPSERSRDLLIENGRDLVIENVTEEDTTYDYRCVVEKIGNSRLNGKFVRSAPRRIQLLGVCVCVCVCACVCACVCVCVLN